MTTLVFAVFATPVTLAVETNSHYYQSCVVEYGDFLERKFDETYNVDPPISKIYLISKANNESYTLKKILQQSDRDKFFNLMEKEVNGVSTIGTPMHQYWHGLQ